MELVWRWQESIPASFKVGPILVVTGQGMTTQVGANSSDNKATSFQCPRNTSLNLLLTLLHATWNVSCNPAPLPFQAMQHSNPSDTAYMAQSQRTAPLT